MKNMTIMLKPASSLCNMRCGYCFYSDVAASRQKASHGIMSRETAAAVIHNTFKVMTKGDHVTFSFQGGEPSLAGLDFFEFFVGEVKKAAPPNVRVRYALQTNGLAVDEDWCRFYKENKFLLGLSLDGSAALHNGNRVDGGGKGTFNRVMKAKGLFDRLGVEYNILCVLSSQNARRAQGIWDFFVREKIKYIQFIPCIEPLTNPEGSQDALTADKFYLFYSTLYPIWKRGLEKGSASQNLIRVQLFEDLISLLLHGQRVTCGLSGGCTPQIIVEADGSVYPCDFYVLDEYKIGDLAAHDLQQVFEAVIKSDFIKKSPETPAQCENCTHYRWCRGGCKRMDKAVYGKDCGMRRFLDECLNDLLAYARSGAY